MVWEHGLKINLNNGSKFKYSAVPSTPFSEVIFSVTENKKNDTKEIMLKKFTVEFTFPGNVYLPYML